jgi:hypothetical protein
VGRLYPRHLVPISSPPTTRRTTVEVFDPPPHEISRLSDLSVLSLSLMLRPTVSRPVCLGIKHPSGAYDQIFYCQTGTGLLLWGALSDDRAGLSFTIGAGPRQRNHSRVPVPRDPRPYFSVSDSRLPFSSPPTTRRATVEVFDPATARG